MFLISIPPLRERTKDIPILATFFLRKLHDYGQTQISQISTEAMDALIKYSWPGNVRELENIIERCASVSEGEVLELAHLPEELLSNISHENSKDKNNIKTNIFDISNGEKELFINALNNTGGNITKASKLLGISRSTFYRKMKRYKVDPKVKTTFG